MGNVVDFFTGNLILNLAILAWAIAQGLKIIITFWTKKKLDWHYLVASGGMPSSHSALYVPAPLRWAICMAGVRPCSALRRWWQL